MSRLPSPDTKEQQSNILETFQSQCNIMAVPAPAANPMIHFPPTPLSPPSPSKEPTPILIRHIISINMPFRETDPDFESELFEKVKADVEAARNAKFAVSKYDLPLPLLPLDDSASLRSAPLRCIRQGQIQPTFLRCVVSVSLTNSRSWSSRTFYDLGLQGIRTLTLRPAFSTNRSVMQQQCHPHAVHDFYGTCTRSVIGEDRTGRV